MGKADRLKKRLGNSISKSIEVKAHSVEIVYEHPKAIAKRDGVHRSEGVFDIELRRIVADKQHRLTFDKKGIDELADSLASFGLQQAIVVRYDLSRSTYVIVAGERRFRAAKQLGWASIRCKLQDVTNQQVAEIQLVENAVREDLNAIERAQAYREVMELNGNISAAKLGKRLGVAGSTITRHLKLLDLDADTQREIASGRLPAKAGWSVASIENLDERQSVLSQVRAGSLKAMDIRKPTGKSPRTKKRKRGGTNDTLVLRDGTPLTLSSPAELTDEHLLEVIDALRRRIGQGI